MRASKKEPEDNWPPPLDYTEETDGEREIRLEKEREAKRVSDAIDLALNTEKEAMKKNSHGAKILLLGTLLHSLSLCNIYPRTGQAESGYVHTLYQ